MIKNYLPKCLTILFFLLAFSVSNASAQIFGITFSRTATSESAVPQIAIAVNTSTDQIIVDQAGSTSALIQNNDIFGLDLFLASGPINTIGVVAPGTSITPADTFAISDTVTALDVASVVSPGDDFFVGFSTASGAGYFNIARELVTDSIIYSNGQFTTDVTLTVPSPVPEPSALALVLLGCVAPMVRRRRAA